MRKQEHNMGFPCHILKSVGEALRALSEREKKILVMRWIDNETLVQVGHKFKVTQERIRQIEAKALRKLAQRTNKRILLGFLSDSRFPDMIDWYLTDKQIYLTALKEKSTSSQPDKPGSHQAHQ